jgi:hypothetical protein
MWPGQETAHGHERHNSNNLDCGRRRSAEIGLRGKCQRNVPCSVLYDRRDHRRLQMRSRRRHAGVSGDVAGDRVGHQRGPELCVHHRRGLRFDGEVQHEHKFMLLRSSGGEESVALQLEAFSHPECDILRGPSLGQFELRDDSFSSMVERRDFRAHRLPTRRDQLRYRGLQRPTPLELWGWRRRTESGDYRGVYPAAEGQRLLRCHPDKRCQSGGKNGSHSGACGNAGHRLQAILVQGPGQFCESLRTKGLQLELRQVHQAGALPQHHQHH